MEEALTFVDQWASEREVSSADEGWRLPFQLAQLVQGIPGALAAGPLVFAPVALRFVKKVVGAPEEFRRDPDGFVIQFIEAWNRVKIPGGEGCIAAAVRRAESAPIVLRGPLALYPHPALQKLASIAYHQHLVFCFCEREQGFTLPQMKLAPHLGVSQRTVSSMLRLLEVRPDRPGGLIQVIDPTWRYTGGFVTAKLYRFCLESDAYERPRVRLRVVR